MKMGRRTKLNAALIEQARILCRDGAGYSELAGHLGVTERSIYGWQARGAKEADRLEDSGEMTPLKTERLYFEFFQTVKQARAQYDTSLRQSMLMADVGWQRYAWERERRNAKEYGRPAQVHVHQDVEKEEEKTGAILRAMAAGEDLPEAG